MPALCTTWNCSSDLKFNGAAATAALFLFTELNEGPGCESSCLPFRTRKRLLRVTGKRAVPCRETVSLYGQLAKSIAENDAGGCNNGTADMPGGGAGAVAYNGGGNDVQELFAYCRCSQREAVR